MTLLSPEVYVLKCDHPDRTGITSYVSLKLVYPDRDAFVHLDAEVAQMLGMQLLMVAAEVEPELVW